MKQPYKKPAINMLTLSAEQCLLKSSVTDIDGNSGIEYGGGGTGPARIRRRSIWDNKWPGR